MKRILTLLVLIIGFSRIGFSQTCEIPPNYFQNPNFEHNLSPLVWTGAWDSWTWGAMQPYTNPEFWLTDTTEAHSGTHSLVITGGSWIWPGVSTVGFQEKDMKMSFWYKSPVGKMAFWMFFYRDAKMTPEEVRAPLKQYLVGADTAYITLTSGTTDEEALYFEMPKATDWTYFEFRFSYPGTIPGNAMTLMFWSEYTPGFIEDVYYGVDFDCQYNGEEDLEIKNADFESENIGLEWVINTPGGSSTDFLSTEENHSESGFQSLQLWKNYNSTYYLPVLGAANKDMNLSFWHKGNAGKLNLNIYEDFGVTPETFPLPAGSILTVDSISEIIEDTTSITSDTFKIFKHNVILSETEIGKNYIIPDEVTIDTLAFQDFENVEDAPYPIEANWSGYYYPDWATAIPRGEFFSPMHAFWLPADPGWTGAWGSPKVFKDKHAYTINFMYKGRFTLDLFLGRDLKYDLVADADNIVPEGVTLSENNGAIHWDLNAADWTEFSYSWYMDTWIADGGLNTPEGAAFTLAGVTDNWEDVGYLDNLLITGTRAEILSNPVTEVPMVTKTYELDSLMIETAYVIEPVDTLWTVNPIGLEWELPKATEWTQFACNWTNPSGDIGSTLTFNISSNMTEDNDSITYFDDFNYVIATGISENIARSIRVFPNPTTDHLNFDSNSVIKTALVYNSKGQLVKKELYPGKQINVSSLPTGLYMIRCVDDKGIEFKSKFIKN